MIKCRRATAIGLVIAFTVSFTVCDADQLSSSRAYVSLAFAYLASFQMERPAQKAPCDISLWRLSEDSGMSRALSSSGSSVIDAEQGFRYSLSGARPWEKVFGCDLNAFESPRAPPPGGPSQLS